jgi:GNAT superfamily N-acetyltransferase
VTRIVEIRPLQRADDRSVFRCGEPALDRYFWHYAGQNQFRLHVAVTYVAVDDGRIRGFATVAVSGLERKTLPESRRRRLPGYPLPVLRLARLGVEADAQGGGVGEALLRRVLELALVQRDALGCVGVVVDAKPDAVGWYERFGFEVLGGVREGALHGGAVAMFLGIEAVAASIEG